MPSDPPGHLRRLAREPLLVFLLLGTLIFAADRLWPGAEADTITVSAAHLNGLRADFSAREGREPGPAELDGLVADWVTEEALYRRARALGLDRSDPLIRRQLVRSMRYLIEDTTPLPEPEEAELEDWLEAHPDRYGAPARLSFEHVFIARGGDAEARALAALSLLRNGLTEASAISQPFPGGTHVTDATAQRIGRDFGGGFAAQLEGLDDGRWQGPLVSRLGWHIVRVSDRTPFQPATLESAGPGLRADYRRHQRERANAEAIQTLRAAFRIERADDR